MHTPALPSCLLGDDTVVDGSGDAIVELRLLPFPFACLTCDVFLEGRIFTIDPVLTRPTLCLRARTTAPYSSSLP